MSETTARLGLPLLAAGQAQKEITHNEALTLLDIAAQTVVESVAAVPPASPAAGQAWIVGAAPSGAFAGRGGAIATWTAGGWRFLAPGAGMSAWRRDVGRLLRHDGSGWRSVGAIAEPSGGTVIDAAARAAIGQVLVALRQQGLIDV